MAFFHKVIAAVVAPIVKAVGVVPLVEYSSTPPSLSDGEAVNLQGDADGSAAVGGPSLGDIRPAGTADPITPSDSGTHEYTSVYVGTGGDLTVDMAVSGTARLFKNVQSGQFLPIRISRVYSSGTAAADLQGLK